MTMLIPALLISFGLWRFFALSRVGILEMWIGIFILVVCIILATAYLAGVLSCAAFC
jgi:hypothetical protein